jgi:hypothetical protein
MGDIWHIFVANSTFTCPLAALAIFRDLLRIVCHAEIIMEEGMLSNRLTA